MWNKDDNSLTDSTVESVVIDTSNVDCLQKLWDSGDFEKIFNSKTHWTRITVKMGSKYDQNVVLKTIMTSSVSNDVFPALYQIDGQDSFFLVRDCSLFIKRLALTGLKLPHHSGKPHYSGNKYEQYHLTITTNYLPFSVETLNPNQQLKSALTKRYHFQSKTLDLTNFSEDEFLKDIFFHINIPQCMQFIRTQIKNVLNNNLAILILQHNELQCLESLDLKINSLVELDLRHNKITWEGFQKLQVKKDSQLSVWLDGNPMCINLPEVEFIKKVDSVIPNVRKIDGIDVSNSYHGHSSVRNFMLDGSWAPFVDHFLHHYFGLMESPNRHQLARMYDQKATLSISAFHNDDTPDWSKLSFYLSHSRNLLTLSDLTKAYSTQRTGPEEIMKVLNKFPVMQFDPNSFTVDVPVSQVNELVLIDVSGIFQDLDSGLFHFNRSFVLTPFKKNKGEWKIQTDMLMISPATSEQVEKSFSAVRRPLLPSMLLKLNSSVKDKDALVPVVCELTKLTESHATRMLEESSWDLERTLQSFIDQLKANQIPLHEFSI